MDYVLHQRPATFPPARQEGRAKIIPPRCAHNLRAGGGRKDSAGWTEQKRKTNRMRFDQLRGCIQTAVTIIYPSCASSSQLEALNDCNRNFCKEKHVPARCVWEGPGYHQHIALGICHSPALEKLWRARLEKHWQVFFGRTFDIKAFLWKANIEPDKIASYLSKTRKDKGQCVKAAFSWLTFPPCWETGFRVLVAGRIPPLQGPGIPRKKRVNATLAASTIHPDFPRYTAKPAQTPEKEREICPLCWRRWGKSLWAGSCKCNPAFPGC